MLLDASGWNKNTICNIADSFLEECFYKSVVKQLDFYLTKLSEYYFLQHVCCTLRTYVYSIWFARKKKICDQLILIQLGWNAIIKALWGAESSKNKTSKGEQPKLSLPPGYFTYLQPKQLNLPTTPSAPDCGNDREQSQSPWHSPSVVFVFQKGLLEGSGLMGGLVLAWVRNEKMMGGSSHKLLPDCYYYSR